MSACLGDDRADLTRDVRQIVAEAVGLHYPGLSLFDTALKWAKQVLANNLRKAIGDDGYSRQFDWSADEIAEKIADLEYRLSLFGFTPEEAKILVHTAFADGHRDPRPAAEPENQPTDVVEQARGRSDG